MYEYLASGKPVIATETPETKLFPDHVHIFNRDNFEEVIHNIIDNENDDIIKERKLLAKENSWENRFKEMEKIILQRLNKE
jgi:glycosyltransferase involved in cell wall biosynthesis